MDISLNSLNKTIVNCKKCPRLVKFINKISTNKRKQNINEIYWGKPVPGFGQLDSKLAIIGLAPAAHGGTRTGRAFTGDKSGDFLFKCLHVVGISNNPYSKNLNDNLKLNLPTSQMFLNASLPQINHLTRRSLIVQIFLIKKFHH